MAKPYRIISGHHESDEPLLNTPELHAESNDETHSLNQFSPNAAVEALDHFVEKNGLHQHHAVFQRAAALLQGDTPIAQVPGITTEESRALQNEVERKWAQPKMLYFTVFICSLGAVLQGWSQTGINGANLFYPVQFGIGSDSSRDALLVGLINSGPYLSTGLL